MCLACYFSIALFKGFLNSGPEGRLIRQPLWDGGLSVGTSHDIKNTEQACEQDLGRYSRLFSVNKLIAFQT